MLLNKLSARYNTTPIMPMTKTQLSTHYEGFSHRKIQTQKQFQHIQELIKTGGKPCVRMRDKSSLNKECVKNPCSSRILGLQGDKEEENSSFQIIIGDPSYLSIYLIFPKTRYIWWIFFQKIKSNLLTIFVVKEILFDSNTIRKVIPNLFLENRQSTNPLKIMFENRIYVLLSEHCSSDLMDQF